MTQFSVHRNKNSNTNTAVPYLLNVQHDLLSSLASRMVIPLFDRQKSNVKIISKLTPNVIVNGTNLIAMTPQMAGIALKDLGEVVADLSVQRDEIIAAIELLITGF